MVVLSESKRDTTMNNIKKIPNTLPKFLLHYLKIFKYPFFGILFFRVLAAILEIAMPYTLKLIIAEIETYTGEIKNIWQEVDELFWVFVGISSLLFIAYRGFRFIALFYMPKYHQRVKLDVFSYLQNHSYKYFADNFAGSLANKFNDIAHSTSSLIWNLVEFFSALVMLIFLSLAFFEIKWWFPALYLTWVVIHLSITIYVMPKWSNSSKIAGESRSKTMGKISDSITNSLNIKLFSGKRFEIDQLQLQVNQEIKDNYKAGIIPEKTLIIQFLIMFFLVNVGMTILMVYGLSTNAIGIADFTFIFLILNYVSGMMFYLTRAIADFLYNYGTAEQALETISQSHSVKDANSNNTINIRDASINISDVSFKYNENSQIFNNFSLIIPEGQKVGIVGHSGAGKSTLSQLLLRYYDIDSGNIFIGGQDIATVTQDSLRNIITVVPQDTSLFHRTIMDNIKYGKPNATNDEVYKATIKANAHDFILNLKHGYKSMVGERGIKLSVGQRQRIAIARAILKDAPIVIMDEATSALDSETEKFIQESMENLMQGKTALVIAHRLSTLKSMDRLIVMENGKIIEDGNHKELIEKQGYYHKLWGLQQNGFIGIKP